MPENADQPYRFITRSSSAGPPATRAGPPASWAGPPASWAGPPASWAEPPASWAERTGDGLWAVDAAPDQRDGALVDRSRVPTLDGREVGLARLVSGAGP